MTDQDTGLSILSSLLTPESLGFLLIKFAGVLAFSELPVMPAMIIFTASEINCSFKRKQKEAYNGKAFKVQRIRSRMRV